MSNFLTASAPKSVTQSPSWQAALTAKAAWQASRQANAADEPTKRESYINLMRQCCTEAGIPWEI